MITGQVNNNLEAVLRLSVINGAGQSQDIKAVIDTGYDGALTLPLHIVAALALQPGAAREVTLGDATRRVFNFYTGYVDWDGASRKIRILCVEGDPLVGTMLLAGYKMEAEFEYNGQVVLAQIQPS